MGKKLQQARTQIANWNLPKEITRVDPTSYYNGEYTSEFEDELDAATLAASLGYSVQWKTEKLSDESAVPLGTSKYHGLPHLPVGYSWPDGHYFVAQLNLEEFHAYDIEEMLPNRGMLYIFMRDEEHCTIHYFDGPVSELVLTEYPDAESIENSEYYLSGFLETSSLIVFKPGYVFYIGSDAYDYSQVAKLIPAALHAELEELLGCPRADWQSDSRVFGRPIYWQGEDEGMSYEECNDMWDDDDESSHRVEVDSLVFHDKFGDGNVHFWVDAEAAKKKDFSGAVVRYSGT